MSNRIIFWRSVPIDVSKGDFSTFVGLWDGDILVVSHNDYSMERKACGYQNDLYPNVKYIVLSNEKNAKQKACEIIKDNVHAIHMFNGIRGENRWVLNCLIRSCKQQKVRPLIGVIAERPNLFGVSFVRKLKSMAYKIVYGGLARRYNRYISCFLAMGRYGVNSYQSYGFCGDRLYPYMYCPQLSKVTLEETEIQEIKFLYIGRFNFFAKGLDVLMEAFGKLPKGEWSLDLVGGYGENSSEVISWCNGENIRFLGSWDSREICEKMKNYDVCIVPSRYDGWNLIPNQAIHCGIATIISDEAVSDELIRYSGAGVVICSGDVNKWQQTLEHTVKEKEIVKEWKKAAKSYQNKISGETVGKYFYDIIQYTFGDLKVKPTCPWEVKEK